MNYFTRWSEARAIKATNAKMVATFIYEEIICRFGSPRVLQSDRRIHSIADMLILPYRSFCQSHIYPKL